MEDWSVITSVTADDTTFIFVVLISQQQLGNGLISNKEQTNKPAFWFYTGLKPYPTFPGEGLLLPNHAVSLLCFLNKFLLCSSGLKDL